MTTRLLRALLILLLLPGLGGCWALLPNPNQQSAYNLDLFFKGNPQAQALALAAEQGNVQEVQRLMKQEGVNPDTIFSTDGMPLLAWPIYTHSREGLRAMLDNGANPNAQKPGRKVRKFNDGSVSDHALYESSMVLAAKQEESIYLKLLLDHGGDPNARNGNDESLVFQSYIWHNQSQNVKLLVERGANVNADMAQNRTILEQYLNFSNVDMAYWLLQHGADPSLQYMFDKPIKRPDSRTIEAAFWRPVKARGHASMRKIQLWLAARGYKRPPMPKYFRDMRRDCGYPADEKSIPVILPPEYPAGWPASDHLCK